MEDIKLFTLTIVVYIAVSPEANRNFKLGHFTLNSTRLLKIFQSILNVVFSACTHFISYIMDISHITLEKVCFFFFFCMYYKSDDVLESFQSFLKSKYIDNMHFVKDFLFHLRT